MAKAQTVTKSDLVDAIAADTGMSKTAAKSALESVIDNISSSLKKGNKVQITGFGSFEVRKRKARTGVKPGTSEKIKIPATKVPAFKAGSGLKDAVK